jgi:hypothetical protein
MRVRTPMFVGSITSRRVVGKTFVTERGKPFLVTKGKFHSLKTLDKTVRKRVESMIQGCIQVFVINGNMSPCIAVARGIVEVKEAFLFDSRSKVGHQLLFTRMGLENDGACDRLILV